MELVDEDTRIVKTKYRLGWPSRLVTPRSTSQGREGRRRSELARFLPLLLTQSLLTPLLLFRL